MQESLKHLKILIPEKTEKKLKKFFGSDDSKPQLVSSNMHFGHE